LISAFTIPGRWPRSVYLKARDRQSYEFALSSAAAALDVRDGVVRDARVALGGVATIDGLIKEADETSGEVADRSLLDAAIVANAQAVEHYEIARYGTLIAWAEEFGHDDIVRLLTTNLNEEKAANTKLNTVALRKRRQSQGGELPGGVYGAADEQGRFGADRAQRIAHSQII
jgi:hypothetical protein